MTRKEEIKQAVNNYKNHFPDGFINEFVYIDGAEWADENPDERMIAKYLYEKKGYPIDLNGNIPSFEETMKDVEQYNKYKQDKLIEKACEWLENHNDYLRVLDNGKGVRFDMTQCVIDFRKAMEE